MAPSHAALAPVESHATIHLPTPRNEGKRPRLSVVLVNYRQWQDTDRLVRQLLSMRCGIHGEA